MNGFGDQPGRKRHKDWADKTIQKTTKELKLLREVIEKYKDDPQGRHKMLKKMRRYWNSNINTIKDLDMKPTGKNIVDELKEIPYDKIVDDYRKEVGIDSPKQEKAVSEQRADEIRQYLEGE